MSQWIADEPINARNKMGTFENARTRVCSLSPDTSTHALDRRYPPNW